MNGYPGKGNNRALRTCLKGRVLPSSSLDGKNLPIVAFQVGGGDPLPHPAHLGPRGPDAAPAFGDLGPELRDPCLRLPNPPPGLDLDAFGIGDAVRPQGFDCGPSVVVGVHC